VHLVIFGSGIIGIFTSYIALKQGYKVTLIEKEQHPASGATNQNGGQLSFSHILSISNIKLINSLLKNLYTNNSPINISLVELVKNYNWCFNFIKHSVKNSSELHSLFSLGDLSHSIFLDIINNNLNHQDQPLLKKTGTIQLFRQKQSFDDTINKSELFTAFNIKHKIIPKNEITSICPSISTQNIYNAIYFPDDICGDAKSFTLALLGKLQSNKNFTFLKNQKITNFTTNNHKITKVITNRNEITADQFILTPGTYVKEFCNFLNLHIPVMPLKGYSFNHNKIKIGTSLIDHDQKIVYSPINHYTRVAGLYDFAGYSTKINNRRIKYFLKNINSLFPNSSNISNMDNIWSGLRPISMDRFPIIGKSGIYKNLYYNVAHGNLGWTLSAGSAQILLNQITHNKIESQYKLFQPNRFSGI